MFVHIKLTHQPGLYTSLMVSNQEMVSQDSVEINKLGTLHIKNCYEGTSEIMKILQERHTKSEIMKNLICLTIINIFSKFSATWWHVCQYQNNIDVPESITFDMILFVMHCQNMLTLY